MKITWGKIKCKYRNSTIKKITKIQLNCSWSPIACLTSNLRISRKITSTNNKKPMGIILWTMKSHRTINKGSFSKNVKLKIQVVWQAGTKKVSIIHRSVKWKCLKVCRKHLDISNLQSCKIFIFLHRGKVRQLMKYIRGN